MAQVDVTIKINWQVLKMKGKGPAAQAKDVFLD